MERHWSHYMHLGFVHFMLFPEVMGGDGPILESLRHLTADDFFQVAEITHIADPAVAREAKALSETTKLHLGFGVQPILLRNQLNLASLDESHRQAVVARVKQAVDEAYAMGMRVLGLFDGPSSYPGKEYKAQALIAFAESLKEICAYAEQQRTDYTLWISLEQFDRDVDKKSLVGPIEDTLPLCKAVRAQCGNFGLLVDQGHLPLLGETPQATLSAAREYLGHIHLGSCIKKPGHALYGDQHPRFGHEDGENDTAELTEFLRTLFEIGYFDMAVPTDKPLCTFELKPAPGEDSLSVMANAKRTFQAAWAQL